MTVRQDQEHKPRNVCLIAGGSGGIGRACALEMARTGSNVAIGYRSNRAAAQETLDDALAFGVAGSLHPLDLDDSEQIESTITACQKTYGEIASVIYAVGSAIPMQWISRIEQETFQEVMDADVGGFFRLISAIIPALRKSSGSVVAITSAGLQRYPARDILSVAPKAAIEQLVRGIAKEEGRHGIRANTIGVGVVDAGMFLRLKESELSQEWVDAATENAALKRIGSGEEIGRVARFLASSDASYVTGQFIAVDGGYSI